MVNLADITGSSVTVPLATVNVTAQWVQFIVTGAGTVRIGDSTVSATKGLPVPTGGGFFLPWQGKPISSYSLAGLYAYIPTGATLSVAYEPGN